MKKMIIFIILIVFISISFGAIVFNDVTSIDIGGNGSTILQLSSDSTNLYFLTNTSINLYNFEYLKSVNLDSYPISFKVYDNIYIHVKNGIMTYDKNLHLIHSLTCRFFDFDYDPDTKTIILFDGNSLKFFVNYKLFKTLSFSTMYDYFSYDYVNKKIILAKSNGSFAVVDQILYTVRKYNYKNYHFLKVVSYKGKVYFLDKSKLLLFDYLTLKNLDIDPLWLFRRNDNLFLVFNDYVLDYLTGRKYSTNSIVKDITITNFTVYFLYQNNFLVSSQGKSYYFVSDFNSIFYNGALTFYDPDRSLFKTSTKSKYVQFHFLKVSYDNFKHYIIAVDESSLYFLDEDFNVIKKIELPFLPLLLKIDKSNSLVFLKDSEGNLYSCDYSKGFTYAKIKSGVDFKLFIPQYFEYYTFNKNSIKIIDSYNKTLYSFDTNYPIVDAVFSQYYKALFFLTYDGTVYEYDLSLNKVLKVQRVSNSANEIISANEKIYVLDSKEQKIFILSYKEK